MSQLLPFRTRKGVNKSLVEKLKVIRLHLLDLFDVRHVVPVHLVPAAVVEDEETGKRGFGAFKVVDGNPEIWIAAAVGLWVNEHKLDPADVLAMHIETMVHELIHYEQWRDGRLQNERGVKKRTDALCRKLGNMILEEHAD